jgi:basic amino acid/polyamine antiporter, APA family
MKPSEQQFVRALGPVMLTAAIVNVIVGGGIFRLPAELAGNLGQASPMAFLLGALIMLPITLCFAAAGSRVSATGGPYSYLQVAFHPSLGFIAGALMWICNIASSAGIAAALMDLMQLWQPSIEGFRPMLFVLLYGSLMGLNLFGVALGGRVLVILATLKLTPLALLVIAGLFFVDFSSLDLLAIPSLGALSASMVAVIFAYSGIETALIPSGEVRDPARDVPRAAFAASLLVVLLYVGIQAVCQATLGANLASDKTAIASAAGSLWGPGKIVILLTSAVSMLGFLMGNLLGSARVAYALGRDGFLPAALGQIGSRQVPHWAIVAHASLACLLACVGDFSFLILVSGGANCLIYLAVAVAAWRLQHINQRMQDTNVEPLQLKGGALIPLSAVVAMVYVLATLGAEKWSAIVVALLILGAVFGLTRAFKRVRI